ncbi:MAG: hypothetical protein RR764_05125 [Oscillospiraceae bacterium]
MHKNTDEISVPTIARYYVGGKIIFETENGQLFFMVSEKSLFIPNILEDAAELLPAQALAAQEQTDIRKLQQLQEKFINTPLRVVMATEENIFVCIDEPDAMVVGVPNDVFETLTAMDIAEISTNNMPHRTLANPLQAVKTACGFLMY